MKLAILSLCLPALASSFSVPFSRAGAFRTPATKLQAELEVKTVKFADELGIPCEEECSIDAYPNMPASVHPGVLSGDALMDLLADAKAKGYAIPAVNCVTSSSINACLEAARRNDAPIMIQASSGGSQFYAGKGLDNSKY